MSEPSIPYHLSPEVQAHALDNAGYMTATAETVALRQQLAEAARELEYERQMRAETEKVMSTLAGRVKEMQAELAEQEKHKLLLVLDNKSLNQRLTDALDSLGDMYDQYCPGKYGHDFMSAGEGAQHVLGQEGLLDEDFNFTGIPPAPAA